MEQNSSYKENYLESLRQELVDVVASKMSPVAKKYGYSQSGLEEKIKWRPVVLLLGNYSSGKSTLINELLGASVQKTGQAPTDDSFTVITHGSQDHEEERDGMVLVNDPEFPFAALKKQGKRFLSHFRLKRVRSPFLENLAIIDTPGMLDSVSERDRGYDYQEVIGEFANIADLILVLFDPHKAGTIRETYESLRRTIPKATYEDRVLFVLNRVDECENLNDLLRVYGTLCWNLSQMTGRKDIPHIHFTYSSENKHPPEFLQLLGNQRQDLKKDISNAPKHRLDHLATYIEEHGEKLLLQLKTLIAFGDKKRKLMQNWGAGGLALASIIGLLLYYFLVAGAWQEIVPALLVPFLAGGVALILFILWWMLIKSTVFARFFQKSIDNPRSLVQLSTQFEKDHWEWVEDKYRDFMVESKGEFSLFQLHRDYRNIKKSCIQASKDAREALAEYKSLSYEGQEAP